MKKTILIIIIAILAGTHFSSAQNQVIHFDGTNDLVNLGGDAGNEIRSIELWFKPAYDIYPTNWERITLVTRNTGDQTGEFGIYIGADIMGEQGRVTFTRQIGDAFYYIYSDQNEWYAGTWYHVAAVIDPVSGMMLYIDGILQEDTDASVQPTGIKTEMTTLGCWGDGLTRWFGGEIDEVRFWNRAITASEITENMCDTIYPQAANGLDGYWRMDEGSGHTVSDYSGMDYSGDIFGAVYLQDTLCFPTLTKEFEAENMPVVFPNPIIEDALITFQNDQNQLVELVILDSMGRLVDKKTGIYGNSIRIQRNGQRPGIYLYILKVGKEKQYSDKLIFE